MLSDFRWAFRTNLTSPPLLSSRDQGLQPPGGGLQNPPLQEGYGEGPWHLAGREGCVEALPTARACQGVGSTTECAKWHRSGDAFPIVKMRAAGAKG